MLKKSIAVSIITLGLSFGAAAEAQDYKATSVSFVNAAAQAMSQGEYDTAQAHFERALVADPANIDAMVGLGKAHEAAGRTGKGLRHYRLALEMKPNHKAALVAQSLAFIKVGEPERASSNLAILERLCTDGCSELEDIRNALDNANKTAELLPKSDG